MDNLEKSKIFELCEKIVDNAVEYFDKQLITDQNKLLSRYDDETARMEFFSRVLYGLAPYCAGDGEKSEQYILWFNKVLLENVVESNKWRSFCDYDQKLCELVPVAFMLILNRESTWDTYSEQEKLSVANWLQEINKHKVVDNNWNFFTIIINTSLIKLGFQVKKDSIEKAWQHIDSFYVGNGWYRDGKNGLIDYYASFAYQFYSLLLLKIGLSDSRSKIIKERAELFSKDYVMFQDKDGSYVPFGRSLCYRSAQVAFWCALVWNDIYTVPVESVKHIIFSNFRYWFSNSKIFNNEGILNIGYTYENQIMSDEYNAYGSPNWALKIFTLLAVSENSSFWHTPEGGLPEMNSNLDTHAGFIVRNSDGSHVQLFPANGINPSFANGLAKYNKFVYSNKFGFSVSRGNNLLNNVGADSILTVQVGAKFFVSTDCIANVKRYNGIIEREWNPIQGIVIRSIIIPGEPNHVRIHLINNNLGEIKVHDGGFSVPDENIQVSKEQKRLIVVSSGLKSGIESICGEADYSLLQNVPNCNILFPRSVVPVASYVIGKGKSMISTNVFGGREHENGNSLKLKKELNHLTIHLEEKEYRIEIDRGEYRSPKRTLQFRCKSVIGRIKRKLRGVT